MLNDSAGLEARQRQRQRLRLLKRRRTTLLKTTKTTTATTTTTIIAPTTMTTNNNATNQDHYSLRWNNHQNHILRAFDALLQTKALVDVTLVCAETSIRAHKMVLSACSPFFARVFAETPCKHPVIVLKDFRGWVVQAIVDFMYRGEISVPQERLQTLIQAGESLQVRGLVESSVPETTPTPAASPDDFGMIDTSLMSSELERCSSFDEESPSMVTSGSKIILPSRLFASTSSSHNENNMLNTAAGSQPDLCTSPMPRRKQARPRRRSGECAPHEESKPSTPTPPMEEPATAVIKSEEEPLECEEMKDDEEEHINPPERPESSLNGDADVDADVDADADEEIEQHAEEKDEMHKRDNDSPTEGPEDLCTKKDTSSNSDSGALLDETNNMINNNNNSNNNNINNNNPNKLNNNRIVLSLKDIRQLNKPPSIGRSSHPPFPPNLRDLDAQMHAAAVAADFHMDQMDLSLAAAAAAAAAQHHQNRQEQQMPHLHHQQQQQQQQQQHAQQQHQAQQQQQQHQSYANSLLGQMGMPGLHPPPGQFGHERIEEAMNRMNKDFTPSSPMSLPSHFNPPDGPPHPPSPLPFPGMSSALTLTPPHMFGLDSPLGLFPPGIDPGKLYNPLMEMSDPRGLGADHPPFLKKKMSRPKGQHSAPRGGPPRSWTNAELTEALQHVWNKKMTTSQASRIFGIPYNSLLMYVRGKYGKSLKLEQLRKDCISGPPVELLQMGLNNNGGSGGSGGGGGGGSSGKGSNNNGGGSKNQDSNRSIDSRDLDCGSAGGNGPPGGPMGPRSSSSEPDLLAGPNSIFNPFQQGFYPDFPGGFPGLPLGMLNLLPPERHQQSAAAAAAAAAMHMAIDEDCKSDRSKQSMDDEFTQPLALNRDERRELTQQNGQD